jgi:mycothiol synthase
VERADRLDGEAVGQVTALAEAAAGADGAYPLSEDALLRLRHGGGRAAVHLLARDSSGRLTGYASVVEGVAEMVVHPESRRRGLGRSLAIAAGAVAADQGVPLRLWAHGDHPGAAELARSLGLTRARVLHQLRRSLLTPVPEPALPAGVVLRAFRPGVDEEAWLAVNARAFADHPEQGGWTLADLRLRMSEPWFDPAGFLLAVRGEEVLGFHWTKVHSPAIGEVYVLGVDPDAHGLGLGTALTLAGLRHLRSLGLPESMLYVDDSNTAAVTLYTRLGFTRWSTDVSYLSPATG